MNEKEMVLELMESTRRISRLRRALFAQGLTVAEIDNIEKGV